MAAAAARDAGDVGAELAPLELIADIVRKTCAKYGWNKSDSTFKTFLKHLTSFADDLDLSLNNLATSSETHTKNADYSSISNYDWRNVPELKQRFQNIPYIIHVGEDNITTVVVYLGNSHCPIKEITHEMMQMIKYLGIVRVYVRGQLVIPCWTDNIIHLEIDSLSVMHYLDTNRIPFPKYLQKLVDMTDLRGSYTNFLPSTLTTLVSACEELRNLSPNLKNYTYTGRIDDAILAEAEYLPIGLEKVIYSNKLETLNISEITMPPGTQYLELGLNRIFVKMLTVKNVKQLCINPFNIFVKCIPDEDISTSNLTLEYNSGCCLQCNRYRQHVDVILEEGLEELIINLTLSGTNGLKSNIEILECIARTPASLKYLSILVYIDKRGFKPNPMYPKKITLHADNSRIRDFIHQFSAIKDEDNMLFDEEKILQKFMQRFPHIEVSIELK